MTFKTLPKPYGNSVDHNWLSFKNAINQAVQEYIPWKQAKNHQSVFHS